MLGRLVILDTGYQTVSVVQDLLEAKLGSGQAGYVLSCRVMQSSEEASTEAEELQVNLKRATGSYTAGSSGAAATVLTPSSSLADGLATSTRNNTSQAAAGSGTLTTPWPGVFNVLAGEWEFTPTPELMDVCKLAPSQAAILSLDEAPNDAITMRAMMTLLITHG